MLPAITAVWNFLTVDMMPVWEALAELLTTVVGVAITALQGLWENVLLPALKTAGGWIEEHLFPIFDSFREWLDKVSTGVGGVQGAIESVVGWIKGLTDSLKNIKLPDWLTPGSPTPFQIGLEGIARAMKDLNQITGIANFAPRTMVAASVPSSATAMSRNSSGLVKNYNLYLTQNSKGENIIDDFDILESWSSRR